LTELSIRPSLLDREKNCLRGYVVVQARNWADALRSAIPIRRDNLRVSYGGICRVTTRSGQPHTTAQTEQQLRSRTGNIQHLVLSSSFPHLAQLPLCGLGEFNRIACAHYIQLGFGETIASVNPRVEGTTNESDASLRNRNTSGSTHAAKSSSGIRPIAPNQTDRITGCRVSWKYWIACLPGEESQQPDMVTRQAIT
jgi:hypothetical protein